MQQCNGGEADTRSQGGLFGQQSAIGEGASRQLTGRRGRPGRSRRDVVTSLQENCPVTRPVAISCTEGRRRGGSDVILGRPGSALKPLADLYVPAVDSSVPRRNTAAASA